MDDYMYWAYADFEEDDNKMEVELGSIYQINHSKLTPRTPVPLRYIRLVMVSEKTEWNVSVRYPSIESLKRYFNNKFNEIYPEMDQRFVMDRKLAERVLFRRVPSEEFLVKKDMEDFWLVMSSSGGNEQSRDVASRKAGFCLSGLKSCEVPGWGVRRQVKFIGKHREMSASPSSSSIVEKGFKEIVVADEEVEVEEEEEKEEEEKVEEEEKIEEKEEREKVEEEEEDEEKDNKEDVKEENFETCQRLKRKCCEVNLKANPNAKKGKKGVKEIFVCDEEVEVEEEEEEKIEEEEDKVEEEKKEEEKENEENVKEEIVENYKKPKRKRCEMNLKVNQKAKKGKFEKKTKSTKKTKNTCMEIVLAKTPMSTRWSEDRYKQAQKHLLEVMKAKGAICEKPILRPELRAEARKKIGDTGLLDHLLKHVAGMVAPGGMERFRRRHNADGAMEYWLESADLVELRREVGVEDPFWTPPPGWKVGDSPTQDPICAQQLKELKEETSRLKRDMKDMISRKQMEKELAKLRREMEKLIAKNRKRKSQAIVVSNPGQHELGAIPTPCNSDSAFAKMEKYYKEQLTILSNHFTRIEGEMVNMKSKLEDKTSSEQALIALTEAFTEKEKVKTQANGQAVVVYPQMEKDISETEVDPRATLSVGATAAAKAAKIERLKSGFRICKPQGTFLWPNSINGTSNVVVQVEDMAVVPTPPSVSSATTFAPPQLLPLSPVRPRPEKRAITVTVSSIGNSSNFSSTTTTTTNGSSNRTTTWINLNDVPGVNVEGGLCGTNSRQQFVSTTDVVPSVSVQGEPIQYSAVSCSKKEVATWLALAAPTDSIENLPVNEEEKLI